MNVSCKKLRRRRARIQERVEFLRRRIVNRETDVTRGLCHTTAQRFTFRDVAEISALETAIALFDAALKVETHVAVNDLAQQVNDLRHHLEVIERRLQDGEEALTYIADVLRGDPLNEPPPRPGDLDAIGPLSRDERRFLFDASLEAVHLLDASGRANVHDLVALLKLARRAAQYGVGDPREVLRG